MSNRFIRYFAERHLLTNLLTLLVYAGGVFYWLHTPREELPDIEFNFVRITVPYPGAAPVDVEHFLIRPIEEKLKGVDGLYRVVSSARSGSCMIRIEIDRNVKNLGEVTNEIRRAVLDAKLPEDITEEPHIRQYKTSHKAIIDIAIYDSAHNVLNDKVRRDLQTYVLSLENRLLSLSQINQISRDNFLKEEFRLQLDPGKLQRYRIPVARVIEAIREGHAYRPAGALNNAKQTRVTMLGKLDSIHAFQNAIIESGFDGYAIRFSDVGQAIRTFERQESILKINGHEGVVLRLVKNPSYGILESLDAVQELLAQYKNDVTRGTSIKIRSLDDESRHIRTRLRIVNTNAAIGFAFILLTLFLFLSFRASLWVAIGIPFSFCFTMIVASLTGMTINNATLAGVIIVMGMAVDDAIVVAENISQLRSRGYDLMEAVTLGTSQVLIPIVASVATTCVAFLPMLFMSGRFAAVNAPIPIIISIMLLGSLLESALILPSHMHLNIPRKVRIILSLGLLPYIERFLELRQKKLDSTYDQREHLLENSHLEDKSPHWFDTVEAAYARYLKFLLNRKAAIFVGIMIVSVSAGTLFALKFKFVLFPREETTEIFFTAEAPVGTELQNTEILARKMEAIFQPYIGKEVIGFRSSIGRTRFGTQSHQHRYNLRVQVLQKENRSRTLKSLTAEWKNKIQAIPGILKFRVRRGWFGQTGGSPIEIMIKENDHHKRTLLVKSLLEKMKKHPHLQNPDSNEPITTEEIKLTPKRTAIRRLGISPGAAARAVRTMLEGTVLYELIGTEENINVRVIGNDTTRTSIQTLLRSPVGNSEQYLVPLAHLVKIENIFSPASITRTDYKRSVSIFADIKKESGITPLEIAREFEIKIFPELMRKTPSAVLRFVGEVRDARESKDDFKSAMMMAVILIYVILTLTFKSLFKPLFIMASVPFCFVGIILAFYAHGISIYGFFTVVGALGAMGVVVNDSIIMLDRLDKNYQHTDDAEERNAQIATIASTRLRAVLLTTFTTAAGLLPTAYGFAGYDSILAEMMLAMAWGLIFSTLITLILIPTIFSLNKKFSK